MITTFFIDFFRYSRAANSEVSDGILPKFKIIQAFMFCLVTCKTEEDPLKFKSLEWSHHFSYYKSMGIFSDSQGQLTHKPLVRPAEFQNNSSCNGCPCYMKE